VIKSKRAIILLLLAGLLLLAWWVRAQSPDKAALSADTDKNGVAEIYLLEKNRVQVWEGERQLWQSPPEWKVSQILLADADNDGCEELLMVLWKHGSYGDIQPFWQEEEDHTYSCHLFMYRLHAGRIKAAWCSSALDKPIQNLSVQVNSAEEIVLKIQEGSAFSLLYPLNKLFLPRPGTWQWQGWGFTRV
jgi:hypothetical protein